MDKKLLEALRPIATSQVFKGLYGLIGEGAQEEFNKDLLKKPEVFSQEYWENIVLGGDLCRKIPDQNLVKALELIKPIFSGYYPLNATSERRYNTFGEERDLTIWSGQPRIHSAMAQWDHNSELALLYIKTNEEFVDSLVRYGILKKNQETRLANTDHTATCISYDVLK